MAQDEELQKFLLQKLLTWTAVNRFPVTSLKKSCEHYELMLTCSGKQGIPIKIDYVKALIKHVSSFQNGQMNSSIPRC